MSDLAADLYKQLSYMVNTSDTMLQEAAVGTKEEIGLKQLLSLTLACSGPHNTVLKSFVSFETLNMPVFPVTANEVAHYNSSGEGKPS